MGCGGSTSNGTAAGVPPNKEPSAGAPVSADTRKGGNEGTEFPTQNKGSPQDEQRVTDDNVEIRDSAILIKEITPNSQVNTKQKQKPK